MQLTPIILILCCLLLTPDPASCHRGWGGGFSHGGFHHGGFGRPGYGFGGGFGRPGFGFGGGFGVLGVGVGVYPRSPYCFYNPYYCY